MISKNWNELIKPSKVQVESGKNPETNGVIIIEPLERGFGLTIGNALRRVLLSSLQGAAITAVKIEGVVHEFDSVAGVLEDVTDIILNLKEVVIRMESSERKRVSINAEGPCVVTAGMIKAGADVEIVNKDHVICTLNKGYNFNVELII